MNEPDTTPAKKFLDAEVVTARFDTLDGKLEALIEKVDTLLAQRTPRRKT